MTYTLTDSYIKQVIWNLESWEGVKMSISVAWVYGRQKFRSKVLFLQLWPMNFT